MKLIVLVAVAAPVIVDLALVLVVVGLLEHGTECELDSLGDSGAHLRSHLDRIDVQPEGRSVTILDSDVPVLQNLDFIQTILVHAQEGLLGLLSESGALRIAVEAARTIGGSTVLGCDIVGI